MIDVAASPPALTLQAPERAERLLACVTVTHERPKHSDHEPAEETLRALCHALSDRVEWLAQPSGAGSYGALLDLGRCPQSEAEAISQRLLARLARYGLSARTGIGPTQTLARLAALIAAPGAARALDLDWLAAHAQALPVSLLAQLEPDTLTSDITTRLRRYGLLTLGHIARLEARDPQALRRQFGSAGAALAALARGADLRPLRPESPPEHAGVRRRFSPDATPDQALAALPAIAARLALRLDARGKQGRDLRLRVVWASGAITRARRRLARPLHQPSELAQAAQGLLATLLAPSERAGQSSLASTTYVTSLTLALGDLSAQLPARPALLFAQASARDERRARAARIERLAVEVGEPLARRYGAPALYRLATTQPDAILPEERAQLVTFDPFSCARPAPASATRATDNPPEASGVTPPQPHWW